MNTTEHLALIKAFCQRNLEIAAKRTPREWFADINCRSLIFVKRERGEYEIATVDDKDDAQFIATCAGAAEAGWKATIMEIEFLDLFESNARGWRDDNGCVGAALLLIHSRRVEILAAYPLSLIKP